MPTSPALPGRPHPLPRRPLAMRAAVRTYDWGSHTALADLQGRPATVEPEAELWLGAHPNGPSAVDVDGRWVPLAQVLEDRLPYLLKVLAVERALSVQVHPSTEHAEEQFACGAPGYVDPYGKPEFVCALTRFEALAGFRALGEVAPLAAALGLDDLDALVEKATTTAEVLAGLVHLDATARGDLSAAAAARAGQLLAAGEPATPVREVLELVVRLDLEHPGDVLVVAPLLLRLHHLAPGGTIFLPTGVPHAYLGGTAVEIMATSDNVVRAGLTTKPVDAEELLACLDPDADAHVDWPGVTQGGVTVWTVPVPDFTLARVEVDGPTPLPKGLPGPRVVLCTAGALTVEAPQGSLDIARGYAAYLPDGLGPVTLRPEAGSTEAFLAATGA